MAEKDTPMSVQQNSHSTDSRDINVGLLQAIRTVLGQARQHLQQTVNHTMVQAYWQVGRLIVEEEQLGRERAEYGKHQLQALSDKLTAEFGKGFDRLARQAQYF